MDRTPTERAFLADPLPAVVPSRFREPLYHLVEDFMPDSFSERMSRWVYEHRGEFALGGDEHGVERVNWELTNVDTKAPDLFGEFRAKLIKEFPRHLAKMVVPDFDLRYVEVHATLHHHGCHFTWHDDAPGYDQEIVPSRRLTYTYYLHTEPKMFSGGELEFLDGTKVEPRHNRLCLFHPVQQHRVRKVECWSRHILHGRWALMGWIHGDPPEGWLDRIPKLRGVPMSG